VFENRVMRGREFRVNGEEVIGGCIELRNGEHHLLYSMPRIIGVIRSRRIK
jgi:hypothetical protein